MLHIYANDKGHIVAANTVKQAWEHHCSVYGKQRNTFAQFFDLQSVEILEDGIPVTKTAKQWAESYKVPTVIGESYS